MSQRAAATRGTVLDLNAGNGLVTGSTHGLVTDTLTYNAFGELASTTGKVGASTVFSEDVVRGFSGALRQMTLLCPDKDDIAAQVVALCTAETITGQTLVIDSGRTFH